MILALISSLSISIGLFQFMINYAIARQKGLFQLRYDQYKEQNDILNKVVEPINIQMGSFQLEDIHSFTSVLMNSINRLITEIRLQNQHLFPGIADKDSSKKLIEELEKILVHSDKLRAEVDKRLNKDGYVDDKDIGIGFERINWHNSVRELLGNVNEYKYDYFKDLREYF